MMEELNSIDVSEPSYLNICAHCGDCLKQIVAEPDRYGVILHYRNEQDEVVEWKPEVK